MKKHLLIGFLLLALGITLAGRLIPHAPNFTPVGALCLFVGMYLAKTSKWFLLLPLGVMFLADLIIGFYDLRLMVVVYVSFLLYGVFGLLILKKKSIKTIALATMAGSFLFYLATNFAVWALTPFYEPNLSGLMLSYAMALPFLKYTLLGDIFFMGVFVGTYEFALAALHKKHIFFNEAKGSVMN
jgi:hypothetical protein